MEELDRRLAQVEQQIPVFVTRDQFAEVLQILNTRFNAVDSRFDAIATRLEALADAQHATNRRLDEFIREQRDYNRASGEAWERVDQRMAQIEETNDQIFRKLESIETALENRGITLD